MKTLPLRDEHRKLIMDRLEHLPRPEFLAGKVSVLFEFNCRPDGSIGDIYIDTSMREQRRA